MRRSVRCEVPMPSRGRSRGTRRRVRFSFHLLRFSCRSGVTAYSALTGGRNALRAGSIVLVQGTGGVSILAAQIAAASGCRVISTFRPLSDEKLRRMQQLGLVAAKGRLHQLQDGSGVGSHGPTTDP